MKKIILGAMSILAMNGCCNKADIPAPGKEYYDSIVKELSSAEYWGRSNYNNGTIKAAEFIMGEMEAIGVAPVPQETIESSWKGKERPELHSLQPEFKSLITPCGARRWEGAPESRLAYLQHFNFPLNTQRGKVELTVDGVTLQNTVNYTLKEFSPSFKGDLDVVYLDNKHLNPETFCKYMDSGKFKDKAVVLDWDHFRKTMYTYPGIEVYKTYFVPLQNVGALICKGEELLPYFKSRNHFNTPMPVFMADSTFPSDAKKVHIETNAEMIDNDAHNIIAYIPGSKHPDKHFIISCHYDHLGVCGDEIFYGASDNSSGTAMLLNLMRHFKKNQPEYSVMFIFFDAEENNLLGSFFYADNPVLPLENIEYFIELDMIGDNGNNIVCQSSDNGVSGIELMESISSRSADPFESFIRQELEDYADHYPFALKGVPAMYMETDGEYNKYYHSPRDCYEHFSTRNYDRIFNLVTTFVEEYRR